MAGALTHAREHGGHREGHVGAHSRQTASALVPSLRFLSTRHGGAHPCSWRGSPPTSLEATPPAPLRLGLTCGELLDRHQREADEGQRLAQDLPLVLGRHLQLLPLTLGLGPADHGVEQAHLADAQRVPLQDSHQRVCRGRAASARTPRPQPGVIAQHARPLPVLGNEVTAPTAGSRGPGRSLAGEAARTDPRLGQGRAHRAGGWRGPRRWPHRGRCP